MSSLGPDNIDLERLLQTTSRGVDQIDLERFLEPTHEPIDMAFGAHPNPSMLWSPHEIELCEDLSWLNIQDSSPAPSLHAVSPIDYPWGGVQGLADSGSTISTVPSDGTSVFSTSPESDSAAGTEISRRGHCTPGTPQLGEQIQSPSASTHEAYKPELPIQRGTYHDSGYSNPSACPECDGNHHDRKCASFRRPTAHLEEGILSRYETSALRDFTDDPAHQYWTWCKEQQNWCHKDKKTDALIWAPLDFD